MCLRASQQVTYDVDRTRKDSCQVQVAGLVIGDSAATVILCGADPARIEQHTVCVVRSNHCVFVIRGSKLTSSEVDVAARGLGRDDGFTLERRSGPYISDEAGDADFAVATDSDISCDGLVAPNIIDPFQIAAAIVLCDKAVIGKVRWTSDRLA